MGRLSGFKYQEVPASCANSDSPSFGRAPAATKSGVIVEAVAKSPLRAILAICQKAR